MVPFSATPAQALPAWPLPGPGGRPEPATGWRPAGAHRPVAPACGPQLPACQAGETSGACQHSRDSSGASPMPPPAPVRLRALESIHAAAQRIKDSRPRLPVIAPPRAPRAADRGVPACGGLCACARSSCAPLPASGAPSTCSMRTRRVPRNQAALPRMRVAWLPAVVRPRHRQAVLARRAPQHLPDAPAL